LIIRICSAFGGKGMYVLTIFSFDMLGCAPPPPNFINWIQQQIKVKQLISSEPHLRLISPRRFDKTSLVQKSNEGTANPRATAKLTVSDRYW